MSKRYVVVSGDRAWTDRETIRTTLSMMCRPEEDIIVEGGCSGADVIAKEEAQALGFEVIEEKADWEAHGKAAGPIRNRKMLSYQPRMVLAFHDNIQRSRGTKDCVKAATQRHIATMVVPSQKRGR